MSADMPRFLITCTARIPSVELGAIIPLTELQKRGLCQFRYLDEISVTLRDIAWCDIMFCVRGATHAGLYYMEKAKELGRKVLGYWDDNLLAIPEYSLSHPYFSTPEVKKSLVKFVRLCDAFFTPNRKLAKELTGIRGDEVKVLPVPLGMESIHPPHPPTTGIPTVGYASGIDHAKLVDSFLVPVLIATATAGLDFKLHFFGAKPNTMGEIRSVETKYTPHTLDYRRYLATAASLSWDIGLASQWQHEFTTYKFYNKLLEYTQIGCAGIYTRIEPYTLVIQDGITGLLVPNEIDAWKDALARLIKDPELRYKIARNAYEFVIANHNRELVAEQYAEALAPYLSYKAPEITKPYPVSAELFSNVRNLWQLALHYIKAYGFWYVLRRGPAYLLRTLFRRS